MTKLRGTFQWMAPEVIITDNYNEKADVYSFGIILWEFWSVEPPYKDVSPKDVAINVKKDKHYRPKIPSKMPNEIVHLMKKCWDYDPLQRPNFSEIIFYIESCLSKIP
jgi:serine/threonine protein kinase